jgi:alkanesulfonate monooxygenase SsuD/methylene tetrahydromethanopterin reductase-like flavin-dependent oxidoreductase (luciferase family)
MWASRAQTRIFNDNRFKLGLFGMNCSGGLSLTRAPERWDASWEHNVVAARLADEAGLEFLLPIGRWHGYKGETDTQGTTFETLTWACGLLASTREITTFGTLHVAFINPVFAAKQIVTADHIGRGRFGLNVVSGWNPLEFGSFGADLRDHDDRYAYSGEWLEVARKIWTETEPFDHEGRFFKLKGVLGKPKPWWGSHPIIVSAGNSPTGRAFAAANADCLFTTIPDLETVAGKIADFRAMATDGRRRNVFASAHLMARPTRKEALDYHHYIVHEMGDWEAAEYAANLRGDRIAPHLKANASLKERLISGAGFPVIGSYDDVVDTFVKLSAAGVDGLACGMINYIDDFKHIAEGVLPRMERAGLRRPKAATG